MLESFLHGFILAFGLILPLGVQNVFVLNQGISQPSLWRALPVVIAAALCDTILILVAVLGVAGVVMMFTWIQTVLYAAGMVFLIYMGWVIWKSDSPASFANTDSQERISTRKQVTFALSVSLLNPHAILDTIGVIGTSSLNYSGSEKASFTAATILVSWIWFFTLAVSGTMIRRLDHTGKAMSHLNKVSAIIIWSIVLYMGFKWIY
ncbi:LysE/ArgO family amino acid transporter [Paenibacillus sediminis]|uniref:L-lysine exporter family protein LysE/ArgO n=1 Tax=Paenibacillus sediminis TaxID=664909 RepID=A0ABS4H3B3_9BACL|nr:LysE/ArgO family amino acid transporter [Paenibacillus sediminis]MBP1936951.1 L-lysine exporter family protein LysE/ArgO [Paenibacillus sediminis]